MCDSLVQAAFPDLTKTPTIRPSGRLVYVHGPESVHWLMARCSGDITDDDIEFGIPATDGYGRRILCGSCANRLGHFAAD